MSLVDKAVSSSKHIRDNHLLMEIKELEQETHKRELTPDLKYQYANQIIKLKNVLQFSNLDDNIKSKVLTY